MKTAALAVALALAAAAAGPAGARAEVTRAPVPTEASRVSVSEVAKGLAHPWALQLIGGGRILVTERDGQMRIVEANGRLSTPIAGLPAVAAAGQGGLLDVALAPDFAQSGTIFFSFSEARGGGRNGTSVARAKLVLAEKGGSLDGLRIIFRQKPDYASSAHFGSRIAIARDGTLFVTSGDRYSARDEAQNPANHLGKVVHITADGSPAPGNPRLPGWDPLVWSIGHRNPQSAAIHPQTGALWTVEHGARGGDEINIPQSGKNYGWPVITYGRDYSGARIGVGTEKAGMEQPIYYWDPSIAPSGMAFYTGDLFPGWKGSLLVGALVQEHLARLVLDGDKVVAEEKLLGDLKERIRDVRQGPDGAVYVATDSAQGRILKLTPAK